VFLSENFNIWDDKKYSGGFGRKSQSLVNNFLLGHDDVEMEWIKNTVSTCTNIYFTFCQGDADTTYAK